MGLPRRQLHHSFLGILLPVSPDPGDAYAPGPEGAIRQRRLPRCPFVCVSLGDKPAARPRRHDHRAADGEPGRACVMSCPSISTSGRGRQRPEAVQARLLLSRAAHAPWRPSARRRTRPCCRLPFCSMTSFSSRGYRRQSAKKTLKWAVLPLAVFVGLGLIYTDFSMERAVYESGVRPFSPMERLLTQGQGSLFLRVPASVPDPFEIDVSS